MASYDPRVYAPTVFGTLARRGACQAIAGLLETEGSARALLDRLASQPARTEHEPGASLLSQAGLIEPLGPRPPAEPRSYRLGEIMVAHLGLTRPDLESALVEQREQARRGRYMWLGEVLVASYGVPPTWVQQTLAFQKQRLQGVPLASRHELERLRRPDLLGPRPSVPLPGSWSDVQVEPARLEAELAPLGLATRYTALLRQEGSPGAALYELGRCYTWGAGVPTDHLRAERCFRLAAALGPGSLEASYRAPLALGLALAEDPPREQEALAWLLYGLAAHARHAATRLPLASANGYERALSQAAGRWPAWLGAQAKTELTKAALQGHVGAQALLAVDLEAFQAPLDPHAPGLRLRQALLTELARAVLGGQYLAGLAPALRQDAEPGNAPALGGSRGA